MIALIVTASPARCGAVPPVGVALDGLLASVVWHRRKAQIAATGGRLAYCHDVDPEPLELPLARCGDDATGIGWPRSPICIPDPTAS